MPSNFLFIVAAQGASPRLCLTFSIAVLPESYFPLTAIAGPWFREAWVTAGFVVPVGQLCLALSASYVVFDFINLPSESVYYCLCSPFRLGILEF